jgi:hypothetical protein
MLAKTITKFKISVSMRESSPQFEKYSVIGFDLMAAGTTQARFDMLCADHGNLESYSWLAGGGSRRYTITKGKFLGYADRIYAMNSWNLRVETPDGETLELLIDCLDGRITDLNGDEAPSEAKNEVFRAVVDAADEREEKDRNIRNFTLPDGSFMANPFFEEPNATN